MPWPGPTTASASCTSKGATTWPAVGLEKQRATSASLPIARNRFSGSLLLARTTNVLLSGLLAGLADAIRSTTDGFSSLGAQRANPPTDPRPDRHHTRGQRTGVKPTDLATAHQISDQVVQRLDAHCGPLRCAVHLEPHDPASTLLLIPGADDG